MPGCGNHSKNTSKKTMGAYKTKKTMGAYKTKKTTTKPPMNVINDLKKLKTLIRKKMTSMRKKITG